MSKHRRRPWMLRYARPLMAACSACGAIITGYLTITKITQTAQFCPTNGCDKVLSSPYASAFGLPLSLFGCFAYLAMLICAIAPLLGSQQSPAIRQTLNTVTQRLLFIGGTAMALYSLYLLYLLVVVFQAVCLYCLASILLSLSLFALSIVGFRWQDAGQMIFTGVIVTILVSVVGMGVYSASQGIGTSRGSAIALAQHLTQIEAKMYGAYWCDHCRQQKQLFGKAAVEQLPYVECDPAGENSQPNQCLAAEITSYPTWIIHQSKYEGVRSLQDIARLSKFKGSLDF